MNIPESSLEMTLAQMVEHTEAAAYADMLRAAPAEWKCVADETPSGSFLFAPSLDVLLFNRLIGCGLDAPASRDDVDATLRRYRVAGLKHFGVQLSPDAHPPEIVDWLEDAGLEHRDNWSKVYRDGSDIPDIPTDLRVEEIDQAHAADFAQITCTVFGMPRQLEPWIASLVERDNWHHYIAWNGNAPAAAGALFIHGEVGWLGIAGTLPAARRRGAQGALMIRRLKDGRKLGCRWFVTETGEDLTQRPNPSFHNMIRAGFKVAYNRPNYMLSRVASEAGG